jgi:CRP-like cAMP-binding protein
VKKGGLGKEYAAGVVILREGEKGDCMYVVQEGQVEVFVDRDGAEVRLAVRGEGEFFGEMAVFEREVRSASVRALGTARILTIDRKNLMRRVHEDPALACSLVETMSRRIRELSNELARIKRAAPGP